MQENVENSLLVNDQRKHKKKQKSMQGNRGVLTLYNHQCEKTGERCWHKEWVNSNPGNIQSDSCKKHFLFHDNTGYIK